jgi:hypothetical protein
MAGVCSHQDMRTRRLCQYRTRIRCIQVLRQVQGDVLLLSGVPDGFVAGAQERVWHSSARVQFARAAKLACFERSYERGDRIVWRKSFLRRSGIEQAK